MKANNPGCTYRIQFHQNFTFDQFTPIASYLDKLGVQTIYASPIFEAVPGSTHGYDGIDPLRINPEIGSLTQLKKIIRKLKGRGMGWLQDIVPNHMAFDWRNQWLMDVLRHGKASVHAGYFDIDWNSPPENGKLMVPFLGTTVEEAIVRKEIRLVYEDEKFFLRYFESRYPLNAESYKLLFRLMPHIEGKQNELSPEAITESSRADFTGQAWDEFIKLNSSNDDSRGLIKNIVDTVNSDEKLLAEIISQQFYRLCNWRETDWKINYRRFFTVNSLICMNMQNKEVFDACHQLIYSLTRDSFFMGLRVDHIDGLYDPENYLLWLRALAGRRTYVVVEKILQPGESLAERWACDGTTGYDFLGLVNNLLTNRNAARQFSDFYEELTEDDLTPREHLRTKKSHVLHHHMAGELDNLYRLLLSIIDKRLLTSIYTEDLRQVIGEFLIHCPVYRFYANSIPLDPVEAAEIREVLAGIRTNGDADTAAIDLFQRILLELPSNATEEYKSKLLHFFRRSMQFTGPLMAKGLEDTLMYTYNNFVAHNDVGDSPDSFGIAADDFHNAMATRRARWPLAMNTTSTHDTKRGEDVRARLNVVGDLPEEWFEHVLQWEKMNGPLKHNSVPDKNEEYLIYQNLLGAFPSDKKEEKNFGERFSEYLQKALREAKVNSSWTEPNEDYEKAVIAFALQLLDKNGQFWKSFQPFCKKITDHGIINSLVQLVLKFTCPGVPDVYQGCEFWDLSFVDPDNRRAVDYRRRMIVLDAINGAPDKQALVRQLWKKRTDGRIKLWLTQYLLKLRRAQTKFFEKADYIPLQVDGTYSGYVFAFARQYREKWLIVAVPLHSAALCSIQKVDSFFSIDWLDTHVVLPARLKSKVVDALFNSALDAPSRITVDKLFRELPFSLLRAETMEGKRNAGLLLHITSLPGDFSIGDLGPAAYEFANFLNRCKLKLWQVLPVNPVDAAQGFSPYSSVSTGAGNPLLISPELLARDDLIDKSDVDRFRTGQTGYVDFVKAADSRNQVFDRLWSRMKADKKNPLWNEFREFTINESGWLNDFALYSAIKSGQQHRPWFLWPVGLRDRDLNALRKAEKKEKDAIERTKFVQFIFGRQWRDLKDHCNDNRIKLLGDLSFYVSHDSVDVWVNREFFSVDAEGNLLAAAGTPPDAFSKEGQYWGMPVYRWDRLKETGFKWWIERINREGRRFDIIRLDHFRAFSAYWEIPANRPGSEGTWKQGPGASFFETVGNELGEMPFVAEDLGAVDEAMIELRNRFNLPGMKVLQFAFDADMPRSDHIPHNFTTNFLVYTGTHDNNTTRGWFRQESDQSKRSRISEYAGGDVTEETVADRMMRLAFGSVADNVVIPMQDVLNLDESARMNSPSVAEGNWRWRMKNEQVNGEIENKLREWAWLFNRE